MRPAHDQTLCCTIQVQQPARLQQISGGCLSCARGSRLTCRSVRNTRLLMGAALIAGPLRRKLTPHKLLQWSWYESSRSPS